jgi:hypothetical protein
MPAKKPKLPKVWVVFNADGVPIAVEFSALNARRYLASDIIRAYAPVQKPKVCVWKLRPNSVTNGETACGWWMDRDSTHKFCARCGGKIRRSR